MRLSHLRNVLSTPAPTSTVLIDASRDAEDAGHEIRLRWQTLADRLREQGAAAEDVAALESAATTPTGRPGQAARLLAARGGRVVLDEVLTTGVPDGIGTATVGPFADVAPLLDHHQGDLPFVVVRIDRTGADVELYVRGASVHDTPDVETQVEGSTFHARKVHAGGWSDRRYDQTVEENWKETGQRVADTVTELAHAHGARLVVAGGDVRARNALRAALPDLFELVEVEGDVRAAGATEEGLELAVQEAVARHIDADVDTVVDRLRMARSDDGPGAAATDLGHTVAALQQGQVSVLVLDPAALRSRTLVVGPGEFDVAVPGTPHTWEGEQVRCPADLALVRAAVLTDAQVELLPVGHDLPDGAAALLRWDAAAEPQESRLP